MASNLAQSSLVLILVTDYLCDLTKNLFICDITVRGEGFYSLLQVCVFNSQALIDCVKENFLNSSWVIENVGVGMLCLKDKFLFESEHAI